LIFDEAETTSHPAVLILVILVNAEHRICVPVTDIHGAIRKQGFPEIAMFTDYRPAYAFLNNIELSIKKRFHRRRAAKQGPLMHKKSAASPTLGSTASTDRPAARVSTCITA
jgi:hypothetical protein